MVLSLRHRPEAFRQAVRDWLAGVLTAEVRQRARAAGPEAAAFQRWWMQELNKVGLAIPHWPERFGGAGIDLNLRVIIADEMARADAPPLSMFAVSLNHIPSTLIPFGTPHQQQQYLPGIPKGDIWCQGFSEPNAGSDLASLRCKAERKGDHYVINGQKIWSSFSLHARYCILLARTNFEAPKHQGISFFILDMSAPGVEVRPIRQANGEGEFGEIFLSDVRIAVEDRVGDENRGWQVSQATLGAERGIIAFDLAERRGYAIESYYAEALNNGASWLRDSAMRRDFMSLLAQVQANRRLIRRLLIDGEHSAVKALPAVVKLTSTSLSQKIAAFKAKAAGLEGQSVIGEGAMSQYLSSFGSTIAAGTNEIMRNIIAERGLGMPKG